jgi:hypothetical protein
MTMILLFLLPTGCRKDDASSDQSKADEHLMRDFLSDDYFATASKYYNPPQADHTAGIATETRTKESMTTALKDYFAADPKNVQKINKKYGYPVWKHVFYDENEGEEVLYLPLALTDKSKIGGLLVVFRKSQNDKLVFHLIDRTNLKKYKKEKDIKKSNTNKKSEEISLEHAVITTAYFEHDIFGTLDCDFLDLLDLNGIKPDRSNGSRDYCYYVLSLYKIQFDMNYCPGSNGCDLTTSVWTMQYTVVCFDLPIFIPDPTYSIAPSNYYGGNGGNGTIYSSLDQTLVTTFPSANPECLLKLNADIKDLLANAKDPCNQSNLINAVTNIINTSCSTINTYTYLDQSVKTTILNQQVRDGLDKVDYIVEKELREYCPKLHCLYNKMISTNNNFVCKYVSPTFDSDKFELTFKVGAAGAGASANVTYQGGGKATLTIDPTLCDGDELQTKLMATMLHEFVHVDLAHKMFLKGYNINDINDYYKFYPKLADYIYNIAATQGQGDIHHNIMIEYDKIIDKMATTLFEMFNGSANGLTVDHFKMAAAVGLFPAMQANAATNNNFNNLYLEFKTKFGAKEIELNRKNLKLPGC